MKRVMLLLGVFGLISACNSDNVNNNEKETTVEIDNNHIALYDIWGLKIINTQKLSATNGIILEINTKSNSFLGNAGCNRISGSIALTNENLISFNNVISTRMACSDMHVEQEYLKSLDLVKSYEIKNLHLLLYSSDGELLLEYIKMD